MATGASAQIPAMAQAATQVEEASRALAGIRSRVAGTVANTQSGYQSEAATVFRSVMEQWDQDFSKIVAGLDRIHGALTGTHRAYQASVEQDKSSANSIMSALNDFS
jgi:WXG100 family type VII secretion target